VGNAGDRIRAKYRDPTSLYSRFRQARARHVRGLIDAIHARQGRVDILDLGGSVDYWAVFGADYLAARNARITLLNRYPQTVDVPLFDVRVGDACAVDAPDGSFDLVHSNSVIEHVGTDQDMRDFAREVRRLAPAYFVQTPNLWFPYEPHMRAPLVHWLPQGLQARIVLAFQLHAEAPVKDLAAAQAFLRHNRLLGPAKMRGLFPDAALTIERYMGLPKSIMAIRR